MTLISRDVQPPTVSFDVTLSWPNGSTNTVGTYWTLAAATERALDESHKLRHLPGVTVDIHRQDQVRSI